jgi:hypothetical protein
LGFKYENDLQCFYIDNAIHTTPEEVILEDGLEAELKFLNNEVDTIGEFVQSNNPFICRNIQECMTLNDQLRK